MHDVAGLLYRTFLFTSPSKRCAAAPNNRRDLKRSYVNLKKIFLLYYDLTTLTKQDSQKCFYVGSTPLRCFALHGLWNFPGEVGSFFSTSFTYQSIRQLLTEPGQSECAY
jgi:hypothetical protein